MSINFLLRKLKVMHLRFSLVEIIRRTVRFLFYGLGVSFILLSFGKIIPGLDKAYKLSACVLSSAILAAIIYELSRRRECFDIAVLADRNFNLKERLSSAVQFHRTGKDSEFIRLQLQDAISHSEKLAVKDFHPFSMPREGKYLVVTVLLVFALHFVPSYKSPAYVEREETVKVLKKEAKNIERVADELEKKGREEGCVELESLGKGLKKVSVSFQNPEVKREEAIASLSESTDKLRRLREQTEGFREMAKELERSELTREIASDLGKGDLAKAQAKMKDLAKRLESGELSLKEMSDLKETLEAGAKCIPGSGELKSSLGKAAKSLDAGASPLSAEALDELSTNLGEMEGVSLEPEELEKAMARLEESCGRIGGGTSEIALRERSGFGEGGLSGGGDGKGTSFAGRQEGTGPEWGVGSTNIEGGSYTAEERANFGRRLSEGESGRTGEYLKLYTPDRVNATAKDEKIKGHLGKGQILGTVEFEGAPSSDEKAYRPYSEVYETYEREAEEAIYHQGIPMGYRQLVREYFYNIKPEGE